MTSPGKFFRLIGNLYDIEMRQSDNFYWDPNKEVLFHKPVTTIHRVHSLAHEVGHARSRHQRIYYDVDLLILEREAWVVAREVLNKIEPDYFQNQIAKKHLVGYNNWLKQRSTCSQCLSIVLQRNDRVYDCHNCDQRWCYPLGNINLNSETIL